MTDYSELMRLAEACGNLNWRFQQENWTEYAIRDDHGYIATMRVGSPKQSGPDPDREAKAKFLGAMTPGAILALIAENENARRTGAFWKDEKICADAVIGQLKAENDAMRTALEKISAYAPCSGIKDPGFTKMHMGILARDAIAAAMSQGEQS